MALCGAYSGEGGHSYFTDLHFPSLPEMGVTLSYDFIEHLVKAARHLASHQSGAVSSLDAVLLHGASSRHEADLKQLSLSETDLRQLSFDLSRTRFEISGQEKEFFENQHILHADNTVSSLEMITAWEQEVVRLEGEEVLITKNLSKSDDSEYIQLFGPAQHEILEQLQHAREALRKSKALFLFSMLTNSPEKDGVVLQGGILKEAKMVLQTLMSSAVGGPLAGMMGHSDAEQSIDKSLITISVNSQVGTSEELMNTKEGLPGEKTIALKAQYQFLLVEKKEGYQLVLDPSHYSVTMTEADWERFRERAKRGLEQKLPSGSKPLRDQEALTAWDVLSLIPLLKDKEKKVRRFSLSRSTEKAEGPNKTLRELLNEKLGQDNKLRQKTSDWIAVCYPEDLRIQKELRKALKLPESSSLASQSSSTSSLSTPPTPGSPSSGDPFSSSGSSGPPSPTQ
jgi:hypothetical protein